MEDLMFELLAALLELFGEILLQLLAEGIVDGGQRLLDDVFEPAGVRNTVVATIGYAFLGALMGGLSVLIFPHRFFRPSRIPGISLVISPVVTASVMYLIGSILRRYDKKVVQIESFGYGFAFAFAMALVRFMFVQP